MPQETKRRRFSPNVGPLSPFPSVVWRPPRNRPCTSPQRQSASPRRAQAHGASGSMAFRNAPFILSAFSASPPGPPATEGTPPCPQGYGHYFSPFHHVQIRPRRNLFIPASFHGGSPDIPPIPPRIFSRTEAHPLTQSLQRGSPMPEHPPSDRKPTSIVSDLLFASLLCTIVVNIFFPEDIYDGIAQTIYPPIQLIAGSPLRYPAEGIPLDLLIFLGGLLIVGACWTASRPDLREYLVFAYVVFFGWVTSNSSGRSATGPAGGPGKACSRRCAACSSSGTAVFRLRRRGVPSTGLVFRAHARRAGFP